MLVAAGALEILCQRLDELDIGQPIVIACLLMGPDLPLDPARDVLANVRCVQLVENLVDDGCAIARVGRGPTLRWLSAQDGTKSCAGCEDQHSGTVDV